MKKWVSLLTTSVNIIKVFEKTLFLFYVKMFKQNIKSWR